MTYVELYERFMEQKSVLHRNSFYTTDIRTVCHVTSLEMSERNDVKYYNSLGSWGYLSNYSTIEEG